MATRLDVPAFLEGSTQHPVFDVRTPAEYAQGHIPGARNLPLFTNEERAEVGTLYKQAGRQAAILRGLERVGPRLRDLVDAVRAIRAAPATVLVHCWRGGMRSESVAWLLETCGYRAFTLRGGYKAFRRHVLHVLEQPRRVIVLGGMTGSGKTDVLHALRERGEQILDLEALAHHKGSVFGGLGEAPQPTQQQFENDLALVWATLDPDRPVWIEDESRRIGQLSIPAACWHRLQHAPVMVLEVPRPARIDRLLALYGTQPPEALAQSFERIRRRLGRQRTQEALMALRRGDLRAACAHALHYYDRAYRHALTRRPADLVHALPVSPSADPAALAEALIAASKHALAKAPPCSPVPPAS
ncbi:MAG: tRNA 2-selenouridine(34) synthase MnmH [Bacteroidetes bacterium]|nr:MAG: tRNA 2-selenouridine(34) synthase MnmH [Bacteroidota bacterium]